MLGNDHMIATQTLKGGCLMKLPQQPTRTVKGREVQWATVRDKGEHDTINQCPRHATMSCNGH